MIERLRQLLIGRFGREDGTRVIASVVLATLLWGWVSLVTDPEMTRTYPNLDLSIEPLPGDLVLVSTVPTVSVRLTGPESVIEDITIDEVNISLDTGEIDEPGTFTLPVRIDAPGGVRKEEATPSDVSLRVERLASRPFPLEYPDEIGETESRQVGQIQPGPGEVTVTVSGRESAVNSVVSVVLPIDIGTHTQDFEEAFTPVALDADGNAVSNVEISPARVEVRVSIVQRGRSVAVLTATEGDPAGGFEVVDRKTIPATVQVDGPTDVLDSTIAISTQPVDITGATGTVTQRVPLDTSSLPPGVTVIQPADGMVEVVVQIAQRGVNQPLPDQPVRVVGLAPGLEATVDPAEIAVTVVSTEEQLQSLVGGDIAITVDVTGLGPGTYELTPSVSVPANMRWVELTPARVQVVLTVAEGSDATPQSSPQSEPAASPSA